MMNSYLDSSSISSQTAKSSTTNPRCTHCGKYYCQIDFIFSSLSRHGNSNDQQHVLDQRIQEIISKFILVLNFILLKMFNFRRLPTSDPQNVCEQRLLHWYNSIKTKSGNELIHFPRSNSVNKC